MSSLNFLEEMNFRRYIKLMNLSLWVGVLTCGIAMVGCTKEEGPTVTEKSYVDFSVRPLQDPQSRAMIDDLAGLQAACTPKGKDEKVDKCIWLWGSYQGANELDRIQNIFFRDTLVYDKKGNAHNTEWNYKGEKKTWVVGASYIFRALYPGGLHDLEITGTDALKMVVKYSTSLLQEDVLVATGYRKNPVALNFKHILSAMKFQFQYKPRFIDGVEQPDGIDNDEDYITKCWLENAVTNEDLNYKIGCFATVGSMNYGGGTIGSEDPQKMESLFWQANLCEREMYEWHTTDQNPSARFWNETTNTTTTVHPATAYMGTTTFGGHYAQNNGWILVIPNYITKPLRVCFTTKLNGDEVYRVILNKPTDVPPANDNHNFEFQGKYYEPIKLEHNKRYTYKITFRTTDLDVGVDIEPWNQVDISEDVIY